MNSLILFHGDIIIRCAKSASATLMGLRRHFFKKVAAQMRPRVPYARVKKELQEEFVILVKNCFGNWKEIILLVVQVQFTINHSQILFDLCLLLYKDKLGSPSSCLR